MNFIFRCVAAELTTDMVINVGDVKFYLHNLSHLIPYMSTVFCMRNSNTLFYLVLKSYLLQKLIACTNQENMDEINIHDRPAAFEVCVKFSYNLYDSNFECI